MMSSKLRFGLPLAIALATASAAAVAQQTDQTPLLNIEAGKVQQTARSGDAKIRANVQELLDRHPELGAPNSITVQARHGVVYLYGEVSSGLERETAESLAKETAGVARVVDSIFVGH